MTSLYLYSQPFRAPVSPQRLHALCLLIKQKALRPQGLETAHFFSARYAKLPENQCLGFVGNVRNFACSMENR